jgi:uncharacterized protein (TIGR02246 family)
MGTREDVQALDDEYGKAVANQDTGALAAFYTADALLLPPNAPVAQGTKAIRAVFDGYVEAGAASLELQNTAFEEHGDIVIDAGRYTLNVQTPDGDSMTDVGKYLQVLKRQADGSFLIAYDCFNSDLPA